MRDARGRWALAVAVSVTGCTALVDFGGIEPYPDGGTSTSSEAGRSAREDATVRGAGGSISSGGAEEIGTGGRDSDGGARGAGDRSGDGGKIAAGGKASAGGTRGDGGKAGTATGGIDASGAANGNGGRTGDGGAAAGGCSASKWYADSDTDQFGDDGQTTFACTAPSGHWVRLGGDCDDGNADVHPATSSNPVAFHGSGYSNALGQESYDYDCNGREDGDPSQQEIGACSGLLACDQGVQGYVARTDRAGSTIDSFCGSTTTVTCAKLAGLLVCGVASQATSQPARRCR